MSKSKSLFYSSVFPTFCMNFGFTNSCSHAQKLVVLFLLCDQYFNAKIKLKLGALDSWLRPSPSYSEVIVLLFQPTVQAVLVID
jgi:hypothetical protein